jgi:hypothetical protein
LLIAYGQSARGGSNWPFREEIDLSSGFGDFRPGHFHFGVDLRTGGTVGWKVLSPVDGYVMRVRTSYYGYGKALYIMGDDGYVYVFGHLADFATKIDRPLKEAQNATRRYFQDLHFPRDSIRVRRGEFIAYSGQTGSGPPHLQFEKRDADNVPLNPLRYGFDLQDKTPPVYTRIGFQMTDDSSVFDTGWRKMFFDVVPGDRPNRYRLDTVLYFHRPFGMLVDCFDRMRPGGMKQTVYKLSLYIDGKLLYRSQFDSLDFDATHSVKLEYDYLEAVEDRKWVRTLFKKIGNEFSGSRAIRGKRGIFGLGGRDGSERIGLHTAKIVAEDCFGNKAELAFEFLWGPPQNVFAFDSITTAPPDTTRFYFTPVPGYKELKIDSIKVFLNRGDRWGPPKEAKIIPLDDGRILCEVVATKIKAAVLRLFLFAYNGCLIRDNVFNGVHERGAGKVTLEHEILEDGLLVTINSRNRGASKARLELYYRDTLLGIEYPVFLNKARYVCFIPPRKEYARIDLIKAAMSEDTTYDVGNLDSVNIVAVGFEDKEEIAIDDNFTLHLGKDNFYRPQFLELEKSRLLARTILGMNSAYYRILPEAFTCRKNFEVSLKLPQKSPYNDHSGICWLDEEEDRWVWLDSNTFEDNVLRAQSTGGGLFAAVFDIEPPRIKYLSIVDGRTYQSRQPAVNFVIEDTLSGIGTDEDIVIKIDGKWLIPEYDPETGQCRAKPLEPLSPGRHHLGIRVTDRAGNLTEQYLNFYVKESKGRIRRR